MTVTNDVKSDFWQVKVLEERWIDVVFDEPVTSQEAQALINKDEYQDIIDEDHISWHSFLELNPLNENVE